MNIGEEEVTRIAHHAHIVLDVQGKLKVVPSVAARVAVIGQNGIVEEDAQAVEIGAQAVEHDDVQRSVDPESP
jgi:hypothetical protein